jgi:hypothetical protein
LTNRCGSRCHPLAAVRGPGLANGRAQVPSKGGAVEWVFWQTGLAHLLPRLLAGRTGGPVFLADRRPAGAVADLDLDPTRWPPALRMVGCLTGFNRPGHGLGIDGIGPVPLAAGLRSGRFISSTSWPWAARNRTGPAPYTPVPATPRLYFTQGPGPRPATPDNPWGGRNPSGG